MGGGIEVLVVSEQAIVATGLNALLSAEAAEAAIRPPGGRTNGGSCDVVL